MTFAGSSILKPAYRFTSSQYPAGTLFPAQAGRNPAPAKAGRKLCTCSIRATLLIQNGILTAADGPAG